MSKKLIKNFSQQLIDGGIFEDIDLAASYTEKLVDYINKSFKDIVHIEPYTLSIENGQINVNLKYHVPESPKFIRLKMTLEYAQEEENETE